MGLLRWRGSLIVFRIRFSVAKIDGSKKEHRLGLGWAKMLESAGQVQKGTMRESGQKTGHRIG